jgi:hypothetical protein
MEHEVCSATGADGTLSHPRPPADQRQWQRPPHRRPLDPQLNRSPIRVLVIADRHGLAFSRRAAALKTWAPPDVSIEVVHYAHQNGVLQIPFAMYDVIFCLPPGKIREIRHLLTVMDLRIPLIQSWNSGPGRIGYELFEACYDADWVIVNNYPAWAQAMQRSTRLKACHISNGVDTTFFHPTVPMEKRPRRVLWLATEQKAKEEWDVKGWSLIAEPLRDILGNLGIETDFRTVPVDDELTQAEMRDFYNSGSVFVITSSSEGTPNTALEAAACGTPIVSTRVGNMTEILRQQENGVLIDRLASPPTAEVLRGVRFALEHRETFSKAIRRTMLDSRWDWQYRAGFYYDLFRRAAAGELADLKPYSYLQVRDECLSREK